MECLTDPAWQVRAGSATALGGATGSAPVIEALAEALTDTNADVRKAAVLALRRHAPTAPPARTALATAAKDSDADADADVRAYATRTV
ncbi:HEAT repeat domain-containing protein [Streptomyces sp. NPDC016845]|uniref:HEAT repeat domain-containing protein n=1 Tax=Streptomyces sp. NPDC016845 TaxID=3364972 RepID=UPI0037BB047C